MDKILRIIIYYLPSLAWALIIYNLSTTAPENLPKFDLLSVDKIGHLCFYAGLTFLLLYPKTKLNITCHFYSFIVIIIAALYGIVLEWVQAYLPERSYDYADMIANFAGCIVGHAAFILYEKIFYRIDE